MTASSKVFAGYDPGGRGRHGVAWAEIAPDGSLAAAPVTATLETTAEARDWIGARGAPAAIGVCALLAWSMQGERRCDIALRARYPAQRRSVITQNAIRSAMSVNGVMLARTCRGEGAVTECHPKLVVGALFTGGVVPGGHDLLGACLEVSGRRVETGVEDREVDALIAAWTAACWLHGLWQTDLYTASGEELFFPAGPAHFPWPAPLSGEPGSD